LGGWAALALGDSYLHSSGIDILFCLWHVKYKEGGILVVFSHCLGFIETTITNPSLCNLYILRSIMRCQVTSIFSKRILQVSGRLDVLITIREFLDDVYIIACFVNSKDWKAISYSYVENNVHFDPAL
jgi:hypothetical protein